MIHWTWGPLLSYSLYINVGIINIKTAHQIYTKSNRSTGFSTPMALKLHTFCLELHLFHISNTSRCFFLVLQYMVDVPSFPIRSHFKHVQNSSSSWLSPKSILKRIVLLASAACWQGKVLLELLRSIHCQLIDKLQYWTRHRRRIQVEINNV